MANPGCGYVNCSCYANCACFNDTSCYNYTTGCYSYQPCEANRTVRPTYNYPFLSITGAITPGQINTVRAGFVQELNERKAHRNYTSLNTVSIPGVATVNTDISAAFVNSIKKAITDIGGTPTTNVAANNPIKPPDITTMQDSLLALMRDCICYSDCLYSYCNCHANYWCVCYTYVCYGYCPY